MDKKAVVYIYIYTHTHTQTYIHTQWSITQPLKRIHLNQF